MVSRVRCEINALRPLFDRRCVITFFTTHGLNFVVLNLNLNVDLPVDVPTILDICTALTTFTFNADRRINPTRAVNNITKRPHPHISSIGVHGLFYGIPVGTPMGPRIGPLLTNIRHRHNDLNMAALTINPLPEAAE
jgi:hypothetical protein